MTNTGKIVDGVTRQVLDPFVVIATENPIGSAGIQMLPESQLDRFLICIQMGYPSDADDSMADYLQKNCPSVPDEAISRLQALILNASYEQLPPYEPTAKPATNQTAKDNNIHLTMVKR